MLDIVPNCMFLSYTVNTYPVCGTQGIIIVMIFGNLPKTHREQVKYLFVLLKFLFYYINMQSFWHYREGTRCAGRSFRFFIRGGRK